MNNIIRSIFSISIQVNIELLSFNKIRKLQFMKMCNIVINSFFLLLCSALKNILLACLERALITTLNVFMFIFMSKSRRLNFKLT